MQKTLVLWMLACALSLPAVAQYSKSPPAPKPNSQFMTERQQIVENHRIALLDMRQQFAAVCKQMDAMIAEAQKRGKPLSPKVLAHYDALKRRFDVQLDSATQGVNRLHSLAQAADTPPDSNDVSMYDASVAQLSKQEDLRNKRQEAATAFQAADQRTSQLMNTLATVVKSMDEQRGAINKSLN
jgi:hypothetical protein